MPAEELNLLSPSAPQYRLQPLQPSDILTVAQSWFRCLEVPDARRTASAFVAELQRLRLVPLAANPLMAALLCQLYGAHPGRRLPAHRSDIFRQFLALLYRRQAYGDGSGEGALLPQAQASLDRYGPEIADEAIRILTRLPRLAGHVAAERQAGNTASPLHILLTRTEAACPAWAPDSLRQVWKTFLEEGLRRSGLFTLRSGELGFVHHTFQEYLAACHVASEPKASKRALRNLYRKRLKRVRFRLLRLWQPPDHEDDGSFVGFLLDAWADTEHRTAVGSVLLSIATRGGEDWIVEQAMLGTHLPEDVVAITADVFHALADDGFVDGYWQVSCAGQMAKLADSRGFETLAGLVNDVTLEDEDRFKAAWELTYLSDQRGILALRAMADDTSIKPDLRIRAACALLEFADRYGAQALAALAAEDRGTTPWAPEPDSVPSNDLEHLLHIHRLLNILHRQASRIRSDEETHLMVAAGLSRLDNPRDHDTLNVLAGDPTLSPEIRTMTAAVLARLGDDRGRQALVTLADDDTISAYGRLDAADALAECADPRYVMLFETLVTTSSTGHPMIEGEVGVRAARLLIHHGGEEGRTAVYHLAVDPALHSSARLKAATVLDEVDDWRGLQALDILSRDPLARPEDRTRAQRQLQRIEHDRDTSSRSK